MEIEEIKRPLISRGTLVKLGISVAFLFWIFLIWNSTNDLNQQLQKTTVQSSSVHRLITEYKNEVQEWKNLLLRSDNQAALSEHWRVLEEQHHKVAAAVEALAQQGEAEVIQPQLKEFSAAHAANFEQYRHGMEQMRGGRFDLRQADALVKGIDRPVLVFLEKASEIMHEEERNINQRLASKTRSQIEQSLFVLAFIALLVVWMPKW